MLNKNTKTLYSCVDAATGEQVRDSGNAVTPSGYVATNVPTATTVTTAPATSGTAEAAPLTTADLASPTATGSPVSVTVNTRPMEVVVVDPLRTPIGSGGGGFFRRGSYRRAKTKK